MAATYIMCDHIKGDTFKPITFTYAINGSAINLTSAIIRIHFRKTPTSTNYYEMTSEGVNPEITIVGDAEDGTFKVDPGIIDYDAGKYYYDIELYIEDTDEKKTYVTGTLTVKQDVTY